MVEQSRGSRTKLRNRRGIALRHRSCHFELARVSEMACRQSEGREDVREDRAGHSGSVGRSRERVVVEIEETLGL